MSEQGYSNCKLLSPEGKLLCRISEKRALWYVKRGLGVVSDDTNPVSVSLTFQPKGDGHSDDPFYLEDKAVICVVCGADDDLTRHHCIPHCFRRYFPPQMKENMSHDILLLCNKCHENYEQFAWDIKCDLVGIENMGNKDMEYNKYNTACSYAYTLLKSRQYIPGDRQKILEAKILPFIDGDITDDILQELLDSRYVKEKDSGPFADYMSSIKPKDLPEFITWWRCHFVYTMEPNFLPEYWSVTGRYSHG